MQKLIEKFKVEPTKANALKIARYDRQHMMAVCLLPPDDIAIFEQALALIQSEG